MKNAREPHKDKVLTSRIQDMTNKQMHYIILFSVHFVIICMYDFQT